MIDLEGLVQKTIALESKYYDLLEKYQSLINEYEKLKDASSIGHRDRPEPHVRVDGQDNQH